MATFRDLALLIVTSLPLAVAAGCVDYNTVASRVSHAQTGAAAVIRREGAMAWAICNDTARYKYFQDRIVLQQIGGGAAVPTFPRWYTSTEGGSTPDGKPIPWSAYCRELDATGAVYDSGVLMVRAYALAVQQLAEAQPFDASGLSNAGSGISAAANALSTSDAVVSAAKGVGTAAANVMSHAVAVLRTRELETLVRKSNRDVDAVLGSLDAYLVALEDQRRDTLARVRRKLVDHIDEPPGAAPAAPAVEAAVAFDAAIDGADRLARYERWLATDRKLVAGIRAANDGLAAVIDSHGGSDCRAKEAAALLAQAVTDLTDARPEEP
jgi:hypothetical protein